MSTPTRLCAIHQPNLFPRLSTLAKIYAADIWVVLDDVQFTRRDYQHRARVGPRENPATQQWMSLSVTLPNGRTTSIRQARIVDSATCQRRVERMTKHHYGRSEHWEPVCEEIAGIVDLMGTTESLADVGTASMQALLRLLGWRGETVRSSDISTSTDRSARLADLTLAVGATEYICGTGGARYLETRPFIDRELRVRYFRAPDENRSVVWQGASRVTGVAAIADQGPEETRRQVIAATSASGLVGD